MKVTMQEPIIETETAEPKYDTAVSNLIKLYKEQLKTIEETKAEIKEARTEKIKEIRKRYLENFEFELRGIERACKAIGLDMEHIKHYCR